MSTELEPPVLGRRLAPKETAAELRLADHQRAGRPGQPFVGLDVEGALPAAALASAEDNARRRLSPRRRVWREVALFDERVDTLERELDERRRLLSIRRDALRDAPTEDAATLAEWMDNGSHGEPPEATLPGVREDVEASERQVAALERRIGAELQRKERYVEKHRQRLTAVADTLVKDARERARAALDECEQARGELVMLREAAIWVRLFPHELAAQMPPTDTLALGVKQNYPTSVMNAISMTDAMTLLRADIELISTALSVDQRRQLGEHVIDPRAARWQAEVTADERQRELDQLIAAYTREIGHPPRNEAALEQFVLESRRREQGLVA
jgi:hypothetical protein